MKKIANFFSNIVAIVVYFIIVMFPSMGAIAFTGNVLFNDIYPYLGVERDIWITLISLIVMLPIWCIMIMSTATGYIEWTKKWDKPFITVGKRVYE